MPSIMITRLMNEVILRVLTPSVHLKVCMGPLSRLSMHEDEVSNWKENSRHLAADNHHLIPHLPVGREA